ncbi:MAG: hypothetical protein ACREXS_13995 [Gammaproteobacteria bacterium]
MMVARLAQGTMETLSQTDPKARVTGRRSRSRARTHPQLAFRRRPSRDATHHFHLDMTVETLARHEGVRRYWPAD